MLNATPGALAGWLIGLDWVGVCALAGATWISSSGVVARLLTDLRRLGNRETPAVLSLLSMEDLLSSFTASHCWGHNINRWIAHPDDEQLVQRVLGTTLVVALTMGM